ncbi:FAD binding domain-containing protein [Pseudonocardia sp.]|uniref:FAD binding domain-containing protein n=1 Tax=Pseudonocardia sp. TaxID=60912 RepID=UPI003D0F7C04
MKPAPFEYVRASSVAEAVAALAAADGEGKILAGGQSLVPVMALRLARPAVLVDVNRIPALAGVHPVTLEPDGAHARSAAVDVGALTRHRDLAAQDHHPLLAEAARFIGHAAIRTRGTAGGSIAHADPAAELPAVAVATGAVAKIAGPAGTRECAVEELITGPLTTTLADDEMVVGLRFPVPRRWGFAEFARRHGDFALVTAVFAEIGREQRIVLGGVGGLPVRAVAAEEVLRDGGSPERAAQAAAAEIRPADDVHAPADHRRALAAEMVRRALGRQRRWT